MIAIVVLASFLIASSSVSASSHFDCEFSVNNGPGLGPIALISETQVAGGEQLDCICANSSVQLEFILPSGAVEDGMTNNLTPGSNSLSISPITGALPNGVYTCSVNGTQEIHAYILPGTGLTRTIQNSGCSMTSTNPIMLTLSTQLTGIVPQTVTCTVDDGSPMVIADPGISIVDRMVSTTTSVSVSFAPTGTMGMIDCTALSTDGIMANFACNFTVSGSSNVASTPSPSESPQISVGSTSFDMFSQIPLGNINEINPLWCQGTGSQVVSWITPQGDIISFDSSSTDFNIETNGANNIGLTPIGSSSFPEGLYTCVVNGVAFNTAEVGSSFQAPVVDTDTCQIDNTTLILSAQVSGGLPNSVSCTPTQDDFSVTPLTTVAPITSTVTAEFNTFQSGQSYSCFVINSVGQSLSSFSCSVLDTPSDFTATLDPTDPTTVTFSWEPSMSPSVDGYTITIFSMDGTVVETVSVSPSTETSTVVMNLNTDQQLSAVISPTNGTSNVVGSSSDPIMIPTASDMTTPDNNGTNNMTNGTDQCKPAQAFTFKLCLKNTTSCDCNVTGFVNATIDSFLQSSCIQNSTECSSPMILDDVDCICRESKEKTKSKRRDEKSPSKRGRGKGKKMGKKGKDKTMKTGRMDDETTMEVCVEGTLLCGSCDPMMESTPRKMTGGRKGGPRGRPAAGEPRSGRQRGRRQGRQRGRGSSKNRPRSGSLRLDEDCPGMLSVQGSDLYTTELKIDRKSNRYCGGIQTTADSCDCPDICN